MSPVIAECEVRPTEEDILQFNRDLFRRGGNRMFYLLSGALFLILAVGLYFASDPVFRWLSPLALCCSAATLLQLTVFLRHSVRRMVRESPQMLQPHRVVLTKDSLLDLPLVGQLPPYVEVNCPYEKMHEVLRTAKYYYFRYNMTSSSLVPRCKLTPEQELELEEKLRFFCGNRFVILPGRDTMHPSKEKNV